MFGELTETSKTLIRASMLTALITGVLGAAFISDTAPYSKHPDFLALVGGKAPFLAGLALGTVFTVIKIILIDKSCKKVLNMESGMGRFYSTGQYFFRFMLTAGIMLLAMFVPQLGFLGCVLGVMTLQIAGYITPMWERRKKVDA